MPERSGGHSDTAVARPQTGLLATSMARSLAVLAAPMLMLHPADSGHAAESPRPNLVVILADDLGYGDLSCYGATDLRTPHVDQLVSRGMRLDNFYANCPVCSPTRASLLTGRYPELVGVPGVIRTHADNSWGKLASSAVLLPQLLGPAGYHTAIVGKWHLGLEAPDRPLDRGFDHFHGFLGDMMDDYYNHRRHGINYMFLDQQEIDPEGHATELFTRWACESIAEQAKTPDRPFFLYLAYNAPHTPIQPPEDWLQRVQQREPGISDRRARLVALIEHMDAGIGEVVAAIQSAGIADHTLIVFTSDNGGQLDAGANNGPLRDGKQSMYEGGLKVPFAAVWPGQIPAGARGDRIALTMDLFPTLCEAAGVPVSHAIEGRSILPVLRAQPYAEEQRDLFFHRREGGERYGGLTIQAVRRGDWKLLRNSPFAPAELYNLRDDPREERDLASSDRKTYRELLKALSVQTQRGGAIPWQPPARAVAP